MASDPIPFGGRSDYVGFVTCGIPSGGVLAGGDGDSTGHMTLVEFTPPVASSPVPR